MSKGIRRAIVCVASVMLLTVSLSAGTVLADGGRACGVVHNTFTKYLTTWPNMAGVVGGGVGTGTFAGEVLNTPDFTATPVVLEALYHFNGSRHSFTALVHVEQHGTAIGSKAVILGVVTGGWLKGNLVNGRYTMITCPQGTCFQGTLDILRGSGSGD